MQVLDVYRWPTSELWFSCTHYTIRGQHCVWKMVLCRILICLYPEGLRTAYRGFFIKAQLVFLPKIIKAPGKLHTFQCEIQDLYDVSFFLRTAVSSKVTQGPEFRLSLHVSILVNQTVPGTFPAHWSFIISTVTQSNL